jgi:Uma2 family endonuclease
MVVVDPGTARPRGLSQAEFRSWLEARPSDDLGHYELLNGRIVVSLPAGWPHAGIEVNVAVGLRRHVDASALGKVLGSSGGIDLPTGDTVERDVSFVSRERLAAGPAPLDGEFVKIVPDLVVEVLSKSRRRRDVHHRARPLGALPRPRRDGGGNPRALIARQRLTHRPPRATAA